MNPYLAELDAILSEPIASVRKREQSALENQLADCDRRVVLFGAGNLGRKALTCLRSIGVEPLAFADSGTSKWETQVEGVAVLSPAEAAARYGSSALFLVSIWSEGHCYFETQTKLEALGCTRITDPTSLYSRFAEQLLPSCCRDLPSKVFEEASDVRRAALLWADDRSRQEYLCQVKWRAMGDQSALSPPVSEASYFPDSIFKIGDAEVFVDCGAYIGSVSKQVIRRAPAFARIFAVEPEPDSFTSLTRWIGTLDSSVATRIEPFNVAVNSKRGKLPFRANGSDGACLAADGNLLVECGPLDELLPSAAPTFIKMDIEGAEIEALEGARNTIQQHRPILAICAYHKQSDLWQIPLYIHNMVEDYELFLRPHEGDGWQLVCYAVPRHRLASA